MLGVLLRLLLLIVTAGSNDVFTWERFGRNIAQWGVLNEYHRTAGLTPFSPGEGVRGPLPHVRPPFNHPPLTGLWARSAVWIADQARVPFRIVFKLLPLAADLIAMWVVWRLARARAGELHAWRAAAVFSTCLTSIVITGHHGNTDSACALLVLIAAALIADGRRPAVAGLAFAAALNVKLIPLVLLPGLLLLWPNVRTARRFAGGLALGLLPFLPAALLAPQAFYVNAIAYQPRSAWWGIPLLESWTASLPIVGAWIRAFETIYAAAGRYLLMAGSLALGLWARRTRCSAIELGALIAAMFLALAPAIGVQYLVLLIPLLVLADLRRALVWGLVSGVFATALYWHFVTEWWPVRTLHSGGRRPVPLAITLVGLAAWALLVELLWSRLVRGARPDIAVASRALKPRRRGIPAVHAATAGDS